MASMLGKRYYNDSNNLDTSNAQKDDDDDEEDDFMSDKFLAEIEKKEVKSKSSAPKTYTQLRKEAQKRKEELGHIKPRAEREREAREEGLKRNLMSLPLATSNGSASAAATSSSMNSKASGSGSSNRSTPEPSTDNKALAMMMKMGFKPGEALGRKEMKQNDRKGKGRAFGDEDSDGDKADDAGDLATTSRGGLGSKKRPQMSFNPSEDFISLNDDDASDESDPDASTPQAPSNPIPNSTGRRIDPIEIQMRSGRSGLGVEEAKRRKLAQAASKERQTENVDDYRSRAKLNHSEKRAEGQLKSVRKTCFELDDRSGVKDNFLWLDPLEEYHKEREKALGARSRFRIKDREGLGGEWDEDNDYGDDQGSLAHRRRDNMDEIELESDEEILDTEEMEKREADKAEFLRLSAVQRLRRTLDYLRKRHNYCFWCGTAYLDQEELLAECPGKEEEDH